MRSLAIAALSFSAAVFAAVYILPAGWLPAAALLLAVSGAVLFVLRRRWLRGFALSLCACAVGLGCFTLHGLRTTAPAALLDGQTREIRAQVVDWPQDYERYVRVQARLHTEGLPTLNVLIYDDSLALKDAAPGDWIELEARLRAADRLYGEEYEGYHAKDIYLSASAKGEIRRTGSGASPAFWPLLLNRRIARTVWRLFPEDTAAFFQALMLGDKTELYRDLSLELALSRAGLMHVVAVSGMHIAFLVGLLQTVLGKNRRSSLLCIALVWLFVLVTGAGPSAVRAGVMQSLLLLAPLVRRENDPLTSLSAALALILLSNPHAAASVSLQLSFASIAGIYCFSSRLSRLVYEVLPTFRESLPGRAAVGAVVNSLSVMPFSIPLVALHFGYVALLSPLTNLLCLWAVTLCFCGAYLLCAVAVFSAPLGMFLARGLAWLARYIFLIARLITRLPFAAVYLESRPAVWWLALSYALFLIFRFWKKGPWLKLGLPALLTLLSLAVLLGATRLDYARGDGTIAALDVGQGQCLAVLSGTETLLIDCGGLGTTDNAGESAGKYLISRGRPRVDALLLTHLDSDHCNGVEMLMEMLPVRLLLLPEGADSENGMREGILSCAARHGTEVVFLDSDQALELGGISARLFVPSDEGSANERSLAAQISLGGYDMLVTGDMSMKKERELLAKHPLRDMELYIVGHHGSKYASSAELLESIGADTAIVSCGYNTYGHPAQETLERIASCGYTVYRTDENGSIEIRIGMDHG